MALPGEQSRRSSNRDSGRAITTPLVFPAPTPVFPYCAGATGFLIIAVAGSFMRSGGRIVATILIIDDQRSLGAPPGRSNRITIGLPKEHPSCSRRDLVPSGIAFSRITLFSCCSPSPLSSKIRCFYFRRNS
jgi:hypothetical protein